MVKINKPYALLVTSSKNNSGVQKLRINAYKKYFNIIVCNYNGNIIKWYIKAKNILFNNNNVKVIICEDIFIGGLIGIFLKKKHKIPVYIRCGGNWTYENKIKNYITNKIKRYVIKNCNLLLVNSINLQNMIGGEVYINGVDTKLFKSQTKVKRKWIGYFGRFVKNKGIKYLFRAIRHLYKEPFILCGNGTYYKDKIGNGCTNIIIYDKLKHQTILNVMQNCKYIIVPTLQHSFDSMPNVVLEAMSCGCIIICTDTGPNKEIIKHKHNGFMIRQRSGDSIIGAINILNHDPKLRKHIVKNALNDIKTKYSLNNYDKMAKRMYEMIR